jgi:alpha-tubulin suppressor-like RCC1 family protein
VLRAAQDGTDVDARTIVAKGSRIDLHVSDARGFVQASVSATHGCAVRAEGTVRCWGDNRYGQLGDGTTTAAPEGRVLDHPAVGPRSR